MLRSMASHMLQRGRGIVHLAAFVLLAGVGAWALRGPSAVGPASAAASLEARTTLTFKASVLRDLGVELLDATPTADPHRPGGLGFASQVFAPMLYAASPGDFERFDSGELSHAGGFALGFASVRLSLAGFRLRAAEPPRDFELVDRDGRRWFWLDDAHMTLSPDGRELRLRHLDLMISEEFAVQLGRPALVGQFVGVVDLDLPLAPARSVVAQGAPCVPDFGPGLDVDVELSALGAPKQMAREAGVRVALAPSANLRNVGEADVEWYEAIADLDYVDPPDVGPHPFLSMHLYRYHDGVMEQIGQSGVKHAFFATNTGCPCTGGHVLFDGCGDEYGASTNDNPLYLGPRDEVTAWSGDWERVGSHFDGEPVDDFRDHGPVGHDDFEHRLVIAEPALETPGAQYFVEAWYLAADDVDLQNSLGHRRVLPDLQGKVWIFPFLDQGLTQGSILDEVVPPDAPLEGEANTWVDTGEGRLQLAVTTQDLGEGRFRFDYALMNFDFDRQVQSFTIPLAPGVQIEAIDFSASAGGAPWEATVLEETLSWQAPQGEALDWGTLVSFRLEADIVPASGEVVLGTLEPGGEPELLVDALAPIAVPEPSGVALGLASLGGLALRRVASRGRFVV